MLTITPKQTTRVYGETQDLGFTVGGLIDGDSAGDVVSGSVLTRSGSGDNVGSYTLSLDGLSINTTFAGKYALPAGPATTAYTITKKSITVADAVVSRAYDGGTTFGGATLSGGEVTGEVSGESLTLSVTGGTFASKNVGTSLAISNPVFSFTAGASTAKTNYDLPTSITVTGTITKKSISVAAAVVTRTYDGTTAFGGASLTGGAVTGEVLTESLTLAVTGGTFASKNAGTGITINSPTFSFTEGAGTAAGNYALPSSITVTGTINAKSITAIGGVTVNTRDWDGTTTATFDTSAATVTGVLTAEQANFRGGLRVSGSFPDAAKTTAGSHNISVTYSLADHGSGTGEFKASNYSIATAAATDTLSGTLTAVVPGVPQSVAAGPKSGAAGDLEVTWSAAASGGATVSAYRVRWRTAQVGVDGDSDYAAAGSWQDEDGDDNTGQDVGDVLTYTIEGLVAGTVYDVSVAATNSVGTGSFATAVQATPTALIVLTITPKQTTRVYGETQDLGFTVGGLIDGDSAGDVVSGSVLTRSGSGDNVGSYTLSLDGLSIQHDVRGQVRASRGAGHYGLHHHQEVDHGGGRGGVPRL